jgi:hypothetical protein
MKAINLLKIGRELLKMMSLCELRVNDVMYIELYADYVKARSEHEKHAIVIMELAEKYGISESSVKRIIGRFDKEI